MSSLATEEKGLGPTGTALRTGITQVADDGTNQPDFGPWRERAKQFGLLSSIAVPFRLGERRAALTVYDQHPFAFDRVTTQGLEEVTREVENGVAHQRSILAIEAALNGTIGALALMTEARDPYTEGHQLRVGDLSAAIASRLAFSAKEIDLIRLSGNVHDVGKISIPAEILTRPGSLNSLEFEMIKRHSKLGSDILTRAALPWPIAEVALQHHERLDGSGYPSGLRGDEIIMAARIVMVADVIEAMAHHRSYRPAVGLDLALAEVGAGAGTRFDADVVQTCMAVFEAGFTFSQVNWVSSVWID